MRPTGKKNVIVRVDGNAEIGYGHFMRCLAIAEAIAEDFHCTFITTKPSHFQKMELRNLGVDWIELNADPLDASAILSYLKSGDIVVLDNYYFDTTYQKKLIEKDATVICVDDLQDRHYLAHAVINHAEGLDESRFSCEAYTRLYHGLKYAMLRKIYLKEEKAGNREENKLLLCLGGSAQDELLLRILEVLSTSKQELDVVLVSASLAKKGLGTTRPKNVKVLESISSVEMRDLMLSSGLAILPSSTLSMEALACRLPFLTGTFVDNQVHLYNGLVENRLCYGLGDLNSLSKHELKQALDQLLLNTSLKHEIVQNQVRLMDLKSHSRIRQIFIDLQDGKA